MSFQTQAYSSFLPSVLASITSWNRELCSVTVIQHQANWILRENFITYFYCSVKHFHIVSDVGINSNTPIMTRARHCLKSPNWFLLTRSKYSDIYWDKKNKQSMYTKQTRVKDSTTNIVSDGLHFDVMVQVLLDIQASLLKSISMRYVQFFM